MRSFALSLAMCFLCRPCVGQDTLDVHLGDGVVNGRLLRPYDRRYTVYELPCDGDTSGRARVIGSWRDRLEYMAVGADTVLRNIIEAAVAPVEPWVDTTIYERSTLALRSSHAHGPGTMTTRYDFHGATLGWYAKEPNGRAQTSRLSLKAPAFIDGAQELVVQALTRLADSETVLRLPFVGVEGIGEQQLEEHSILARVLGNAYLTRPRIGTKIVRRVMIGAESDRFLWIEPESRQILISESAQYESVCPRRFILDGSPR